MKTSLKKFLQDYIKANGYLSLEKLEELCKMKGKKLSNGERRLRELCAANQVSTVTRNGAIIAYNRMIYAVSIFPANTNKFPPLQEIPAQVKIIKPYLPKREVEK